jgi:uncharacterized phage protein (TIGR01671 family)
MMPHRDLFKGKRIDNDEWVQGYYISTTEIADIYEISDMGVVTSKRVEIDPSTMGQCTGMNDKNGKPIFGGDVCEFIIGVSRERYLRFNPIEASLVVVEFKRGAPGFRNLFPELIHEDDRKWIPFYRYDDDVWDSEDFSVVGNIHDNLELLKGGDGR